MAAFLKPSFTAAVLLMFAGCAVLPTAEKSASARETRTAPAIEKTAPSKPDRGLRRPSAEDALLRSVPERVAEFLRTLKSLVLSHEFEKVKEKAEPSHLERFVKKRGMDTESYLSRLFRIGAAYVRGESALLPEPGNFTMKTVTAMRYTQTRRENTSWIVQGMLTDARGVSIDFTLEVLGELETILLAGD
jgi:hypothetical protein